MYGPGVIYAAEEQFPHILPILGEKLRKSLYYNIKIYENKIISGPVVFLRLAFTHKSGIS